MDPKSPQALDFDIAIMVRGFNQELDALEQARYGIGDSNIVDEHGRRIRPVKADDIKVPLRF